MPRVRWSAPASLDLIRLFKFLEPMSREAAVRALGAIKEAVKILGRQPEIGRPVEDLPAEFRELVIPFGNSGYIARYHYDGKQVVVLAVRHGKEAGYIERL